MRLKMEMFVSQSLTVTLTELTNENQITDSVVNSV